ncbi:hypothetical protein HOD75_03160 [archaeon]|jgi:hypothetical protein|nr:hypothetical protein [archaeon]MBT4241872.1 hypothetical protein [archaeon]MBT4418419.1 hypothetical protein [archaeon]
MTEILEKIIKEKISADHLLYVSMKYTKTCDVMINLIRRWKIMMDSAFDGLLEKAKKKKMVKKIPSAPKLKLDLIKEVFKDEPDVMDAVREYEMFKLIDILKNTKEGEFRKGVCLRITYRGDEVAVNLDKLKEYAEILERFINYTKLFLSSK